MTADAGLVARATALALPFGEVVTRRMFGGYGLYLDGAMFAIVSNGVLYVKTDATTLPRFESAGSTPFTYMRRGRSVRLSFWTLPAGALDAMDAFLPWAELALAAARKSKRISGHKKRGANPPRNRRGYER